MAARRLTPENIMVAFMVILKSEACERAVGALRVRRLINDKESGKGDIT